MQNVYIMRTTRRSYTNNVCRNLSTIFIIFIIILQTDYHSEKTHSVVGAQTHPFGVAKSV